MAAPDTAPAPPAPPAPTVRIAADGHGARSGCTVAACDENGDISGDLYRRPKLMPPTRSSSFLDEATSQLSASMEYVARVGKLSFGKRESRDSLADRTSQLSASMEHVVRVQKPSFGKSESRDLLAVRTKKVVRRVSTDGRRAANRMAVSTKETVENLIDD
eukprot:4300862-Prymnesium_polylepis.1